MIAAFMAVVEDASVMLGVVVGIMIGIVIIMVFISGIYPMAMAAQGVANRLQGL